MPPTTSDPLAERVNRLYWTSDQTVDDIVDQLGISRSALYSSVRPSPAGANCPQCGERLVFTNRSSRTAGVGTCTACGAEAELGSGTPRVLEAEPTDVGGASGGWGGAGAPAPRQDRADARDEASGWSRWREDLAAVPRERAALIGGAAALGVVVGAAAARAVRDRI